jgi:hypothetical protein
VRQVLGYALRGVLSGLLCCAPGLLVALWRSIDGTFMWLLLFVWWAPGVTYGVLVAVPLAIALKRSQAAVALAFFASVGGYFAALRSMSVSVFETLGAYPLIGLSITGAVGASILATGILPWRGAAARRAALLTIVAGAIAARVFEVTVFTGSFENRDVLNMIEYTVWFVVWQSATAACLSLGLLGRHPGAPSKSRRPSDGDLVGD